MSAIHFNLDFQKWYVMNRPGYKFWWGDLRLNINSAVRKFEAANIRTVFVMHGGSIHLPPMSNGIGLFQDVPKETLDILAQNNLGVDFPMRPSSLVAFKNTYSAYQEHFIADYVRAGGFSTVILSGLFESASKKLSGDFCVSKTARAFSHAGYEVLIAAEATQCGIRDCGNQYSPLKERNKIHARIGVKVMPVDDIVKHLSVPARPQGRLSNAFAWLQHRTA